jgi:hypothetical protein
MLSHNLCLNLVVWHYETDTSTHTVSDTWIRIRYDTHWIRLGYVSVEYPEKINADKLDTFSDMYWATMAH